MIIVIWCPLISCPIWCPSLLLCNITYFSNGCTVLVTDQISPYFLCIRYFMTKIAMRIIPKFKNILSYVASFFYSNIDTYELCV